MSAPVLWHIPVSHYNEKARWALDHKGIAHERRAPMPGAHMAVAAALTRGRAKTFPLLQLDGRAIADSTAIIAALEARFPERRLYPEDPQKRARALELEEFFDEELGPYSRLAIFHVMRRDERMLEDFTGDMLPGALAGHRATRRGVAKGASLFLELRYRVATEEAAAHAQAKVVAAFDRLERELEAGRGEYLVGDSLTVADLTAASLFNPVVLPPEGPEAPEPPAVYEEFRGPLRERSGYRWVEETFARHRAGARRP